MSARNVRVIEYGDEWQAAPVSELCESIVDCVNKTAPVVPFATPYRMIRTTNIKAGRLDLTGAKFVTEETFRIWTRRAVPSRGDVILTREAPLGEVATIRDEKNVFLGQRLVQYRADRSKLDPSFLFYAFQSQHVQAQIHAHGGTGSTVDHIRVPDCGKFVIRFPPLAEQRAIARILGALDDKIELNRKMNETLEAMARALFKSWFVDFDPVRAKAEGRAPSGMDAETAKLFPREFVESELGLIPRGWSVDRLANLTTKIGSGATPRGGDRAYVDEGISFIRSQNVYDSAFEWSGLVRITDDEAQRLAGVTVQLDDVLLNITGASILRTCLVEPDVLPARVNQHVAIVRAREGIPSRYLHNHLLQGSTKSYLLGMNAGASREAVTKGHLESVPVVQPPEPVLLAWHRCTAPLYERIRNAASESRTLGHLRDELLPRLLSGELSLDAAEREVEAVA